MAGRPAKPIPLSKFMVALLRKLRETRNENTVHGILMSLTQLRDEVPFVANNPPMPERFHDLKWVLNYADVEERISQRANCTNSRYTFIKNILSALNADGLPEHADAIAHYRKKLVELGKSINEDLESHSADEHHLSWDKIIEHRDAMEHRDTMEYLIVCLYTMIQPLRNDFVEMDIVFRTEDAVRTNWNYYVVPTRTIHLNAYKTSKRYGAKQIVVPEELHEVISRVRLANHRRTLDNQQGIPMLVGTLGARLQHSAVNRLLTREFGQPMGVCSFRKSFVSQYGDVLITAQSNADAMCHSLITAVNFYAKV